MSFRTGRTGSLIALISMMAAPATADVLYGESWAQTGSALMEIDLGGGNGSQANLAPVLPISGIAPPAYGPSQNLDSTFDGDFGTFSNGTLIDLTGTVNPINAVDSTVDGTAGTKRAAADADVVAGTANLVTIGSDPPTVSIQWSTMSLSASVEGMDGALNPTGPMSVASLSISVNGTEIFNVAASDIVANTVLNTGLAGVSIVLNERFLAGDGQTIQSIQANGVHVSFNDFVTSEGTVNGDFYLLQTYAELRTTAIPEPSSALLLGLVGGVAVLRRRRRLKSRRETSHRP